MMVVAVVIVAAARDSGKPVAGAGKVESRVSDRNQIQLSGSQKSTLPLWRNHSVKF